MLPSNGQIDVLVIGAGPTGLTAALELRRRNLQVVILDRKDGPTPLSRAVGISPRSLDILEASGVTERLLKQGLKVNCICLHSNGEKLAAIDFSKLDHRFNFMLSLPQADTESTMVKRLVEFDTPVCWNTEFLGMKEKQTDVEVSVRGPEGEATVTCQHVYGADGVHSAVRTSMGADFSGLTHKRTWSIADVEFAALPFPPNEANAYFHRNGDLGFIIAMGGRRARIVSNTANAEDNVPFKAAKTLRTDTFSLPVRGASRYQTVRVAIGGDAAHVHSPLGARGMNLGIEDAASYARRLSTQELSGYSDERKPVGENWMHFSETLLRVAQTSSPWKAMLRNMSIRTLGEFDALQKPMIEQVAGLRER